MVHVPNSLEARVQRAEALLAQGRFVEAARGFIDVLAVDPSQLIVRRGAIHSLLSAGDADEALRTAQHAALFAARDEFAGVLADFGAFGAWQQHAGLLRGFADNHPEDAEAALALASALHALGRPADALQWANRVLDLQPTWRIAREIRATSLIDRGDVEAGLEEYQALLPDGDAGTAARYLVLMHYDPVQTSNGLFAELAAFAQRHLPTSGPSFVPQARTTSDPLRIGWLSPRIGAGPVATFLSGLLANFDRTRFRHVLVDLTPAPDASSPALRALADDVVDAARLDDDALLARLRGLRLDIVIDLAGHSTSNRLGVLAHRVAPLQVCWLDWFDTTAVPAMDAWISDPWLTPADSTQRYSERLVRLASGRFSYTPPHGLASSSVRTAGDPVVFASFNRLAKFNDAVVDTWARLLHRIPDATLALRARLLDDPATRDHIIARFTSRGIGGDRLDLAGALPYRALLENYCNVDIALDPFPFSGCTTTCDALWMGCPVITLPGETFVSRQSASLVWRLGHDEWVARDVDDYIERGVVLARDVEALRNGRSQLRAAVVERLCNSATQALEFAALLQDLHAAQSNGMAPDSVRHQ